jgi:hypothetical protein
MFFFCVFHYKNITKLFPNTENQRASRWQGGACHLLARWFSEPIPSTLKMEAISSFETSGET